VGATGTGAARGPGRLRRRPRPSPARSGPTGWPPAGCAGRFAGEASASRAL